MLRDPKVGEIVQATHTEKYGKVVIVEIYWGWFRVRFLDGKSRDFRLNNGKNDYLKRVTIRQRYDYYEQLQTYGLSLDTSWHLV
jgi:hypothetical protein